MTKALVLIAALAASPAAGGEFVADALAAPADPAYGAYLAAACVTCHRADGPPGAIPRIVGLPRRRFLAALALFRSGQRRNPAMQSVALGLDPTQAAALALHFEQKR